jgi:hypothetical protein
VNTRASSRSSILLLPSFKIRSGHLVFTSEQGPPTKTRRIPPDRRPGPDDESQARPQNVFRSKAAVNEYCEALSMVMPTKTSVSESEARAAIRKLDQHIRGHRCCSKLRFQRSASDRRWNFRPCRVRRLILRGAGCVPDGLSILQAASTRYEL